MPEAVVILVCLSGRTCGYVLLLRPEWFLLRGIGARCTSNEGGFLSFWPLIVLQITTNNIRPQRLGEVLTMRKSG